MGLPLNQAMEAIRLTQGVSSVTRGHPRGACLLPCAWVRQTGQTVRVRYDDRAYLTSYELTVTVYALSPAELDGVAAGTMQALEGLGFSLLGALEISDMDGFQREMRFTYQD